jgi:hypothetical protein
VSVSNFQNCNQQIEAISNRLGRLEESVSSSLRTLRTDREAKLAEMKAKRENDNETVITRILSVERKLTEITGRLSTCESISNLLSPLTSRLTVCEGSLEHMKSEWEIQNRSLKSVERSVSLLGGEFARKISESLSPVTGRLSICETDLQRLKSHKEIAFPLQEAKSLQGIIFFLTRKHGGNVHDKGVVIITSRSVDAACVALRNLADLTSGTNFRSKNEPGQWVCWDFHQMRVRPTHYTIGTAYLKSAKVLGL